MNDQHNYNLKGYLIKKKFFDVKLISAIYEEVTNEHFKVKSKLINYLDSNTIEKKNISIENGNIKYLKNPQIYFKSINYLVEAALFKLANNIVGENIFLNTIELHQKYPGASETPPHQDNFYFCLEKGQALTAYIPLNDQSFENGALAVIPGSHKHDLDHRSSDVPGFSSGIDLTEDQKNNIDHYSLKTGDLSIHHCNIVHLAPANNSKIPRLNIAIRLRSLTDTTDVRRLEKYKRFRETSVRIA